MKATFITFLTCLYIQIAVPHRLPAGGIARHRKLRPMIIPVPGPRQVPHPILTMQRYLKPYRLTGLGHRRPIKPFHFMKKYFVKKAIPRKLNTQRHLRLRPTVLNQPRNMHRLPLTNTRSPRIRGNFRRLGNTPLPVMFRRHLQSAGPRTPVRRHGSAFMGTNIFGMRRVTMVGARPGPFRFPLRDDDFDDFDFEIPGRRVSDTDMFDDLNDIDDTFDERFEEGFGMVGGIPRRTRQSNDFNRDTFRTRPNTAGGFGLDFNQLPQGRSGMMVNSETDMAFRDNLGPRGRFNEQITTPVTDFDDNRFKKQFSDFVDDVLDSDKVDMERIHENFERDDKQHEELLSKIETKAQPNPGIIRADDVPDLVDVDDSSRKTVIEGFEMLGDRHNNRVSDIIDIFQGDLFDLPTDPFSKARSEDDIDQSDDDNRTGTFALLGIDPASLTPTQKDNQSPGVVTVPSLQPQSKNKESIPVKWPLDFGFSNDVNMNIVLNDVPPASSL